MITEATAIRLVSAIERVADVLERGASSAPMSSSERAVVADLIVGGPEALKALNKRNRAIKTQTKKQVQP